MVSFIVLTLHDFDLIDKFFSNFTVCNLDVMVRFLKLNLNYPESVLFIVFYLQFLSFFIIFQDSYIRHVYNP